MNEQLCLFEKQDWKDQTRELLKNMVKDLELPNDSLYLMENLGRDGEKVTSYSICIYEPDYPDTKKTKDDLSRNSIVLNIREGKSLEILIDNSQLNSVGNLKNASIKPIKSSEGLSKIITEVDNEALIPFFKENVLLRLKYYVSKAKSFGCCSHFIECSDAKHCVHENKLYGKACTYRHHLDAGEIFYGKNKNI